MDTKDAGNGVAASEPTTTVAEGDPGGRPASAAPDGDAASTPDASPGPAPSSSSERRAGAAGTAPTPATPPMTPEAALRSALGLCDYLMRHWSQPGEVGTMPSVFSTRDDVIAGLLACGPGDYGAPRSTLRAFLAAVRALAAEAGIPAAAGACSVTVQTWDNGDRACEARFGASIHRPYVEGVDAMIACVPALSHADSDSPGTALAALREQLVARLILPGAPDGDGVLDETLPEVAT